MCARAIRLTLPLSLYVFGCVERMRCEDDRRCEVTRLNNMPLLIYRWESKGSSGDGESGWQALGLGLWVWGAKESNDNIVFRDDNYFPVNQFCTPYPPTLPPLSKSTPCVFKHSLIIVYALSILYVAGRQKKIPRGAKHKRNHCFTFDIRMSQKYYLS